VLSYLEELQMAFKPWRREQDPERKVTTRGCWERERGGGGNPIKS
jgi:hypothetical protein